MPRKQFVVAKSGRATAVCDSCRVKVRAALGRPATDREKELQSMQARFRAENNRRSLEDRLEEARTATAHLDLSWTPRALQDIRALGRPHGRQEAFDLALAVYVLLDLQGGRGRYRGLSPSEIVSNWSDNASVRALAIIAEQGEQEARRIRTQKEDS